MINKTIMSGFTHSNRDIILEEDKFRNYIEDHLIWLRERSTPTKVEPIEAYRFKHDIFGYLMYKNIEPGFHWIYMRINGMTYNWQFNESIQVLFFPPNELIDSLIDQYNVIGR